ncbi:hypothetical protein BC739_000469 [Kutzneria viridogrisea]|uniref:Uncharacterized protein n=1 Tax=Kutzneria viridogrisea TaxID=47990 RepID=A0ABR6B961_9PSEU|nr:hypothetical protein [Kutzneria viridogrisea]
MHGDHPCHRTGAELLERDHLVVPLHHQLAQARQLRFEARDAHLRRVAANNSLRDTPVLELLLEVQIGGVQRTSTDSGHRGQRADVALAPRGQVTGQQHVDGGTNAILDLPTLFLGDSHV